MNITDISVERWLQIRLFVLDFDGILNDGYVYICETGLETNRFSHLDGNGVDHLLAAGIIVHVLSGQVNKIVETRCTKLKISWDSGRTLKSAEGKLAGFEQILLRHGLQSDESLYMGDDVNDLLVLQRAGIGITVPNGHPLVLQKCPLVTVARGRYRECLDYPGSRKQWWSVWMMCESNSMAIDQIPTLLKVNISSRMRRLAISFWSSSSLVLNSC